MSTDNWEKRFDAVVKETEEKLARVKGTLSTPRKYNKYSILDLDTSKLSGCNRTNSFNKSQDEVSRQQDEISSLRRQIKKLEENRTKQEEETRNLRGQITTLKQNSTRTQAHIRDKLNEDNLSQFDILRSELRSELASLKNNMLKQYNSGRVSEIGSSKCTAGCTAELQCIKKDLAQNRSNFAEETQEMRNEMDNLRSRMMKAELELSNMTAENKELNRKQGRFEKEMMHVSETNRLQNKSTNNNIQSLSEAAAYVSLMRTNIGDLQKRFSSLEDDLNLKMNSLQRTVNSAPCSERGTPNVLGSRGSSYLSSEAPRSSSKDKGGVKKSGVRCNLSLDDLENSIGLDDLSDNEITVSQCSLLSNSIKLTSANTANEDEDFISGNTLLNEDEDFISGIDDLTSFNNYNEDDDDLISGMSGLLSDGD